MEIRIGIQNVTREIVIDSTETAESLTTKVTAAIADGGQLLLTDAKGRTILVPAATIGYVEIGAEEVRKVGFAH
ncbi:DUF3107 domain-containing protein [Paeniglutamicibacter cryotolerans]|uniref:DUF3107 domain-containing protein n=1 Tax=Paeniglutamicibacter cryotolerans TaxID=670079 RepID=A0A839QLQ2_9MICC|nr:DUF3107 domain-containing protein [Paeniglutamicibacter cryotolerans]MBB2996533.1 hypothetical protein [Paeniglutamicibacter cryotolerans]